MSDIYKKLCCVSILLCYAETDPAEYFVWPQNTKLQRTLCIQVTTFYIQMEVVIFWDVYLWTHL